MNSLQREIRVPDSLARYHEKAMSVLRHQFGAGPVGPREGLLPAYNHQQMKFLGDIAQAFHNLTENEGIEFFYTEAVKINAAWKDHLDGVFEDGPYRHYFEGLWPLPEGPSAGNSPSLRSAPSPKPTNTAPLPIPRQETPIDPPLRLAQTNAPFRGTRPLFRR